MARTPVQAAGGIVTRCDAPLIAVVRLRKRDHWVLPKGKLDPGETARDAAEREVVEETGHDVTVHEFVGTVVYEAGGRPKIVHFWRMEAETVQSHALMRDIKAVAWLPLEAAIAQLTRNHEQAFLAEIGPMVLEASQTARLARALPAREQVEDIAAEDIAAEEVPLADAVVAAPPSVPARDASLLAGKGAVAARPVLAAVGPMPAMAAPALRPALSTPALRALVSPRPTWFTRAWRWLSRDDS